LKLTYDTPLSRFAFNLNVRPHATEQQMNNFSKKKELENQRLDMFDEGIQLYNNAGGSLRTSTRPTEPSPRVSTMHSP